VTPAPGAEHLPLPFALAVAAVGGGLLATAFPSLGWWPAAPAGIAAISLATRGQRARRGALLGLIAGLAFFLPHLQWSGVYVGTLPWVALTGLEASFVALLGALLPLAWRAPGGRFGTVITTGGLWVGQEALRGRVPFGGFPWGRLAFSQADAPSLGWAALGGAPLVTAAVAVAGTCLAVAVTELASRRSGRWVLRGGVALVAGIAAVGAGAAVPTPTGSSSSTQVAAVQGNVPHAGLDFNAQRMAVLSNHVLATARLADRIGSGQAPQPDVVIWPENASDIDPLRNPDAADAIQAAVDRVAVPVVVGAVLVQPAHHLSNAAIVWGPTGTVTAGPGVTYVKRHPAPFGEYIPYRSFFRNFSDKVDLVRLDFAAGDRAGVLPVGQVRMGDVICFEVAYDSLVRDTVQHGANLLVVQTNNATFGYTDESVQQLAMSRLRAVENGRAVVHISTVGVSALIAPDGRIVARSGHFTQQVLQARLPLRTEQTVATRLGEWPEFGLSAAGLLLAGSALVRRRSPVVPAPAQSADNRA
jgi:apolipoprotein N-acyltransferase